MAKVRIRFDKKTGNSKILGVEGVPGEQCLANTAALEKALGQAKEDTRVLTEEYYTEEITPMLTVEETDG